jgi:misacylated tRNA(Ala) deacylase
MEQPSLNDHNKQEYPPMHTTEHVINRTMVNLFGCGRAISAHIERKKSKLDFALQTCPEEADIIRIENTVVHFVNKHRKRSIAKKFARYNGIYLSRGSYRAL